MKKAILETLNIKPFVNDRETLIVNNKACIAYVKEGYFETVHVYNKKTKRLYVGDLVKVEEIETGNLYIYGQVITGQKNGMLISEYKEITTNEMKKML